MSQRILWFIALVICPYSSSWAFDSVKINSKNGMFTVEDHTLPVVTAKNVSWQEGWKWASAKIQTDGLSGNKKAEKALSLKGEIKDLDIGYTVAIDTQDGATVWTYDWDKRTDFPEAIGVGIDFALKFDPAATGSNYKEPELLPDNQGWRWQTTEGNTLEVKFSPAIAKVGFHQRRKNEIMAMFFSGIEKGNSRITMTVKILDKNAKTITAKMPETESEIDKLKWHADILSDGVSPIDLSFLNEKERPAGKHGFVKAVGDSLVFADGSPARFWGTNVMAITLFESSDDEIRRHAKRIASLGFNLVRLHHHDSSWIKKNIFKNPKENTRDLLPDAVKKIDSWIKALEDEGIYVWLDLHVGRTFTEQDGIEDYDELAKGRQGALAKGFNYYNTSVQKAMQEFNETYLNHVNALTGRSYKDDPGILAVLITNENDLTQHFGHLFLKDKGNDKHHALFAADVANFASHAGIAENKTGMVWKMGEGKMYLSDVEHRFNEKMMAHLKGLGVKPLMATTSSWGKMGLFGLPSLADGDLIDAHSYGVDDELKFNPRYNPGFLSWIGAAQVSGKPLSVSEWNLDLFPVADRHTVPIYTSAVASLQGWDAMMLYGYNQEKFGKYAKASNWSAYNDPSIMGLMPAAALLYRESHVSPAKKNYQIQLSSNDFFFKRHDPATSMAIRTLLETSRVSVALPETKELPWLKATAGGKEGVIAVTDMDKDYIPSGQEYVESDTGELKRDWQKGIHTVDSDKSKVIAGDIGGQNVKLKGVSVRIAPKSAVVAVQSLDGQALVKSKNVFLTLLARSLPQTGNKLPYKSEPVSGEIEVTAPAGLKLYPIDRIGKKVAPVKVEYSKGAYLIKLDEKNKYHWFVLSS